MSGDEGPYVEMDGPRVWVPETVPYRRAWRVARDAIQEWDQVLRYRGREDAELIGFTRDCSCLEGCEERWRDDPVTGESIEVDRTCVVPAWAFEIVERGEP